MMLKLLKLAIISWLFFSCNPQSEVPGYTRLESGIFFKLHRFGDDSVYCKPNDFVTCNLIYQTPDDSTFFEARRTIHLLEPEFPGAIDECFFKLSKGDSASFLISADNFFIKTLQSPMPLFFMPNSKMKISIEVIEIKDSSGYAREKEEFLSWVNDFGEYEQTILKHYIEKENISANPETGGIIPRFVNKGNGKIPKNTDTLTIHYEGRFLNGKIFDSTKKRNEPFVFVLGHEWQVIPGLEQGIRMMDEGSKAIFIIPSHLAFGNFGSSSGIIGPFTPVIFEVELVGIK